MPKRKKSDVQHRPTAGELIAEAMTPAVVKKLDDVVQWEKQSAKGFQKDRVKPKIINTSA
jgi:hypothetical protein